MIPEPPKKTDEMLGEMLDDATKGRAWEDITRIGVVTGPGSFTGVRVGIAAARGLALALNIPCNGVTVFEALAFEFSDNKPIFCVVSLPTKKIGAQGFKNNTTPVGEPIVMDETKVKCPSRISRIAGSAADMVKKNSGQTGIQIVNESECLSIEAVAQLVNITQPTKKPEPVYLREPVTKEKKETPK